jgi:hypothetical protein
MMRALLGPSVRINARTSRAVALGGTTSASLATSLKLRIAFGAATRLSAWL